MCFNCQINQLSLYFKIGMWRICRHNFWNNRKFLESSVIPDNWRKMGYYGSREVHFFGPLPLVYIPIVANRRRLSPIVADCRLKSPIVAARRRLSPIRDRKIRATKKSSLMPCGLRVLNVHVKS